jgi:CubicO group peptidase (beta-lactamase class C family)
MLAVHRGRLTQSMKLLRLLLAALLLVPGTAAPTGAAGNAKSAFDMWLAAHNSGERERLEAFNAKYKVANDVQIDLDFRDSIGSLRLIEFKTSRPTSVEALLVSEWGKAMLARIGVDAKDAFKLTHMEFENVPTPDAFKPKRIDLNALVSEAGKRLDTLRSQGKLSGSLLLARDGKPILEWTGGLADREASVPVSPATQFRMASLGKMITAVAILQLAEAGRLALDDPLSKHLADYPNRTVADAITLRQLLNHTSGTGDVFGEDFEKISGTLKTHRDYWGAFAATPLEFEAGAKDRYSNYGYILLGAVIEAVSGQSYYDYVEQHIYRPAGMVSTGSEPESTPVPNRANAYTKVDGKWSRENASLPWRGTAAGGGYTTAGDLLRFATALQNGTLISAESREAATRPQNHKAWYGYGFMVSGAGDERQYGHEGGSPGSNAILNVEPARGYVVIGLSNFDPSTMANMVNFITQRLPP